MSSCNQTLGGLTADCAASMGGIIEVLLANFDDVDTMTETTGKISAITMVSTKKFLKYYLRRQSSSLTSTLTADDVNGTQYVENVLALVMAKMTTTKRTEINAIRANELRAIVRDANDTYWLIGRNAPVVCKGGDGLTGTASGDRNGYTLNLGNTEKDFPIEVDSSIISGLL